MSENEIIRDIKDEAFNKVLKANRELIKEIKRLKKQNELEIKRKGELLKNNLRLLKENTELKKQITITKEKIVEVLKKYQIREIEKFTPQNKGKERCVWEREPEQIALEILGDDNEYK